MIDMNKKGKSLEELDKQYIWHPFTQMQEWLEGSALIVREGRDCFLKDTKGTWYLDGVSSLWVNIHGHRREEINAAIKEQLDRVAHSTLLGLASEPSISLAQRIVELTPDGLKKVFYSDNGSTAVEVALKMAFQYWQHKEAPQKRSFLSLKEAYHGDTLGAVSMGGIDLFHEAFGPLLFKTYKAPSPNCYRCELGRDPETCGMECLARVEAILKEHGGSLAGMIMEPLVQAAGGMICHPEGYLQGVRKLCDAYNVLLILDEVATGFGRTGRMFACEHENVSPDILCMSKGITGGYLPLAATVCTDEIYNAFLGEFRELKTFFHGHSYTGNQLGCAAAMASLDLFEKEHTLEKMQPGTERLREWLDTVKGLPHVGDARARGLMGGVELVRDRGTKEAYPWEEKIGWQVVLRAQERGLILRPLGNVIVIMPPLAISGDNLERMLDIIHDSIRDVTGQ